MHVHDLAGQLTPRKQPVDAPVKAHNWLGGSLQAGRVESAVGAAGRGGAAARAMYVRKARADEEVVRGLDADVQAKYAEKLAASAHLEAEACEYVSKRAGAQITPGGLMDALDDGTVLCALVNAISPGIVKKVHRSKIVMFQNENIEFFQGACRRLGVSEGNLFALTALRERSDPLQVIQCVLEIKRLDLAGQLHLDQPRQKSSKWTVKDTT